MSKNKTLKCIDAFQGENGKALARSLGLSTNQKFSLEYVLTDGTLVLKVLQKMGFLLLPETGNPSWHYIIPGCITIKRANFPGYRLYDRGNISFLVPNSDNTAELLPSVDGFREYHFQ